MTAEQVGIAAGLVTIAAAFGGVFWRMGRIALKVDTLWDFIIRRAKVEFVNVGWGKKNSPVEITAASMERILPFISEVVAFYARLATKRPKPTERDIFIAIEQRFGERIIETICIPHKVNLGACIVAVMEACRKQLEVPT